MSENIEKKIFSRRNSGIGEGRPERKEGKPAELEEPEEEEKLTKECWETYVEELKIITKLAQGAGFAKVLIAKKHGTRLKHPDTFFFARNSLDNFREALKFIEKKDLYQGIKVRFSEMKRRFEGPKIEIYQDLDCKEDELEELREEIETNEKELPKKAIDLIIRQENIDKLGKKLNEDPRTGLSESEIEEEALKFTIMDILYGWIEDSMPVKVVRLKEFKDKNEISPAEYQKQFLEISSPPLRFIREKFPNLDEDTLLRLNRKLFETEVEVGKKYLKYKAEKDKYGLERMYR